MTTTTQKFWHGENIESAGTFLSNVLDMEINVFHEENETQVNIKKGDGKTYISDEIYLDEVNFMFGDGTLNLFFKNFYSEHHILNLLSYHNQVLPQ